MARKFDDIDVGKAEVHEGRAFFEEFCWAEILYRFAFESALRDRENSPAYGGVGLHGLGAIVLDKGEVFFAHHDGDVEFVREKSSVLHMVVMPVRKRYGAHVEIAACFKDAVAVGGFSGVYEHRFAVAMD